jgi:hypothetical protein
LLGGANVIQYLFAQNIGIALTGFGEGDDLGGDGLPNVIGWSLSHRRLGRAAVGDESV